MISTERGRRNGSPLGMANARSATGTPSGSPGRTLRKRNSAAMTPEYDETDLSDLLGRTPGPLCILDTQTGRVTASNEAFAALLGLELAQVTGLSLSGLVADADRQVADYVLAGLASGLIDSCQARARLTVPDLGAVDGV